MTGLTTTNTTALAIPKEFQGFTEEEALGGMAPIQEGYRSSYKYFLSRPSTLGKFEITNNVTKEVVWTGDKIEKAVIFYSHEIMRLKQGHVDSPGKAERDFDDDEDKVIAITYDSEKSKGSFEPDYVRYLGKEHEHLHGKMKRVYIVMMLPELKDILGLEPVLASFSITTKKTLNALRKTLQAHNLPLPLVRTNIFFSEAKSGNDEDYLRIDFEIAKDAEGKPLFAHKSAQAYRKSEYGLKMLNAIIDTHKGAVQNAERGGFGTGVVEAEASGSAYSVEEDITTTFKGKVVEDPLANKKSKDEVPW